MKKIAVGLIAFFLISSTALAQSNVTIYGAIDEAVVYSNNAGGGSVVQMLDSYHWNTVFGFRGTEDLGAG